MSVKRAVYDIFRTVITLASAVLNGRFNTHRAAWEDYRVYVAKFASNQESVSDSLDGLEAVLFEEGEDMLRPQLLDNGIIIAMATVAANPHLIEDEITALFKEK